MPNESGAPEILTIGHSTHESHEFVALLRQENVELLIDVRRYPGSRRVPWTDAEKIEGLLAAISIGYMHAPALGGRRQPLEGSSNGGWRNAQFQGYADHLRTPEFAEGLARLEAEARHRRTAIMCAEAQWWRCHRRLLSDVLLVRGWRVLHIDSRGGIEEHALTQFATVEGAQVTYPTAE